MADNPDFLPSFDGIGNLGLSNRPWDTVYIDRISNGTIEIPVENLLTIDAMPAVGQPLYAPTPLYDEGKILVARSGKWMPEEYPAGALPPVTDDSEGMVMQVVDGKWTLAHAMTLPAVDSTMDGATIRVIGGKIVPYLYGKNPSEMPYPCPVAPEQDNYTLMSRSGKWITDRISDYLLVPPIGTNDIGKYLTVQVDQEASEAAGTTLYSLQYTRPPIVDETNPGALPPLPGDYKQFYNGAGGWSAVTAGNNGHWRVGDMKLSVAPISPGFVKCDGGTVGKSGSGAVNIGNQFRQLFAIIHGGTDWETAWNNNSVVYVPNREYYQIRYSPDGNAPAEASILFDAFPAAAASFFQVQTCRNADFSTSVVGFNSYPSPAGFYRLGGDLPELLSSAGDLFPDEESILFDITSHFNLQPGLWFFRARQLVGSPTTPSSTGRWKYGSFITTSA